MPLYNEDREGQKPTIQPLGGGSIGVNWEQQPTGFQQGSEILKTILSTIEQQEVKKQETEKKKFDMYKTLRELDYDHRTAYNAAQALQMPSDAPPVGLKDQKTQAEIDKINAETAKANAEAGKAQAESDSMGGELPPGFVRVQGKVVRDPSYSKPKLLTGSDAKMLAQAKSLTTKLDQLSEMVGTSSENYWPYAAGNEKGQEFQTLKDDIKSTLLYLRSGSAVTPQEYQRLSRLLPQLLRTKGVDKSQLKRFKDEFSLIISELEAGKRGSTPSNTAPDDEGEAGGEDYSQLWS